MWSVLIIDDERNFCAILEDYIAREGGQFFVRTCFTDGQLAWDWLEKNDVDLIITDIRMPNMTGLDLAQRLYEANRDIPLIVISGYSDFDYAKRAIQYGVVNYLLKPVDFAELGETLERLDEQFSARRSAQDGDSRVILFLFYAMAGLLGAQDNLANAASAAHVPFSIESDCFRLFEAGANAAPDSDRLQRRRLIFEQAAAYMRAHAQEDPSREDVARAAFVSQSYLSHVFSDIAGMSFVEYQTKIRMEKAVALLATGRRISEIAEAVGYRSRKAFLANFRAFTGLTPSEYRLKYCIGGDSQYE